MEFLQIFITGLGILLVAMLVNFMAHYLGIETWYSFFALIQEDGFLSTIKEKWFHLIFLLFVYPFILGLTAYYVLKLFTN